MISLKAIAPNKDIVKKVLDSVGHPILFIPTELIDNYEFNSSSFSDSDFNDAVGIWISNIDKLNRGKPINSIPCANKKILNVIFNEQSECETEAEAFYRTSEIINKFLTQIGWYR